MAMATSLLPLQPMLRLILRLIFVSSASTVAEGGSVSVGLSFNLPPGETWPSVVALNWSISGTAVSGDYSITGAASTASFGLFTGDTSPKMYGFSATADNIREGDETIIITITDAAAGSNATHTITITDGTAEPTVSVSIGSSQTGTITEASTTSATVTVAFGGGITSTSATTVSLMRGGSAALTNDYTQSGLTVTTDPNYTISIPENMPSATFTLTAVNDSDDDDDENITFTVQDGTGYSPATGGSNVVTVTITDDDMAAVAVPPVTGLAAAVGHVHSALTWTNPTHTGLANVRISATSGSPAMAVDLNGGGTTGNDLTVAATSASSGSQTVTGLTNGTEYTFSVVALDGDSNESSAATATVTPQLVFQFQSAATTAPESTSVFDPAEITINIIFNAAPGAQLGGSGISMGVSYGGTAGGPTSHGRHGAAGRRLSGKERYSSNCLHHFIEPGHGRLKHLPRRFRYQGKSRPSP